MYRECTECKSKAFPFLNADGRMVSWFSWKNVPVQKPVESEKVETHVKMQSKTVKEMEFGTLENLSIDVMDELPRVSKHVYNIKHQYSKIREL